MSFQQLFTSYDGNVDADYSGVIVYTKLDNSLNYHGNILQTNVKSKIVCVLDIQSFLVPTELITFFQSFSSRIDSIRIFKHLTPPQSSPQSSFQITNEAYDNVYMAILQMKSDIDANAIIREFSGLPFSSLDSTAICMLVSVQDIHYENNNVYLKPDIIDDTECSDGNEEISLNDVSVKHSMPFLYRRTPGDSDRAISTETTTVTEQEDSICVVCLESLFVDHLLPVFTMYCGHSFHSTCVTRLEPPQCPVCRFEHDTSSSSLTECVTCGWHGMSTHSTRVHSHQSQLQLSSLLTTSLLPLETDRDIWVCLVCGFTGCGHSHLAHIQEHYANQHHAYAMNTDTRHVWDFAGQGYVHRLAIQQQQVEEGRRHSFDVQGSSSSVNTKMDKSDVAIAAAGIDNNQNDGDKSYMSRHIGSASNENGKKLVNSAINATPSTLSSSSSSSFLRPSKLFEIADPHTDSPQRPTLAPLTAAEEERAVSLKIESVAQQHSSLLAREMAAQRRQHEEALNKIRSFMRDEARHLLSNSGSNSDETSGGVGFSEAGKSDNNISAANANKTEMDYRNVSNHSNNETEVIVQQWLTHITHQLQAEKLRALKQQSTARARLTASEKECAELSELNRGLRENEAVLRTAVQKAQLRLSDMESSNKNWKESLERKIQTLMNQLEG